MVREKVEVRSCRLIARWTVGVLERLSISRSSCKARAPRQPGRGDAVQDQEGKHRRVPLADLLRSVRSGECHWLRW
jgi:hypothetical protein